MALYPDWQERVAEEAQVLENPAFSVTSKLKLSRDVFREALRLYPPVPMMVREAACPERFRDRDVPKGAQIVLSPWHLHRHERLWDNPDGFDPAAGKRKTGANACARRICRFPPGRASAPGRGFAMVEGPLLLSMLLKRFRFERIEGYDPVPVAFLTVRAKDGIRLRVTPRQAS